MLALTWVAVPTCHSDCEVPHGLFVSSENTNINARILICYVSDFHDGAADLDARCGQNANSLLVPVDRHAGPCADVTAQLQDIAWLQEKMFGGVFAQLLKNICWSISKGVSSL